MQEKIYAVSVLQQQLESRVKDLEDTVALLLSHLRSGLKDHKAIMELEDMTRGTASYYRP